MKYLIALPLIALIACQTPIKPNPPPPPTDKLTCLELPAKPVLKALEPVEISGVLFYRKDAVDTRDGQIATYIIGVRDAWFACSSNLGWVRDYYEGQ